MNIPKKIKIGGLIYTVSEDRNSMRDRNEFGSSCGNSQEISIGESASTQLKETTFIHELLHQIDFVYNIGLEHQHVYQLEAGLYALIKDNPELFKNPTEINKIHNILIERGLPLTIDSIVNYINHLEHKIKEFKNIKEFSTKEIVEELSARVGVESWTIGVEDKYSVNVDHKNNMGTGKCNVCGPAILLEIID